MRLIGKTLFITDATCPHCLADIRRAAPVGAMTVRAAKVQLPAPL